MSASKRGAAHEHHARRAMAALHDALEYPAEARREGERDLAWGLLVAAFFYMVRTESVARAANTLLGLLGEVRAAQQRAGS